MATNILETDTSAEYVLIIKQLGKISKRLRELRNAEMMKIATSPFPYPMEGTFLLGEFEALADGIDNLI